MKNLCLLGSAIGGLCLVALVGCSADRDNPDDQRRCSPACSGAEVCFEGRCVAPDGGVPDAPPPDLSQDAAPPDSAADAAPPCNAGDDSGSCTYAPAAWIEAPAATYSMGSPADERCREPGADKETAHEVTLTHDLAIFATEVAQHEFAALRGYNPAQHAGCGTACPVENVTWHEAAAYCAELSAAEGHRACYECTGSGSSVTCTDAAAYAGDEIYTCPGYRLPTEAEWEYAYRAGTTTALPAGALTDCTGADAKADAVAWYAANAGGTPHPVGQKQANAWGLYDMAGNVAEWVHDAHVGALGAGGATDPVHSAGPQRGVRGGAFDAEPGALRAAARGAAAASERAASRGFRCVRSVPRWRAAGELVVARRLASTTVLQDGRVLVVGGQDQTNDKLTSAELYDPATGKWSATGSMTTARASHPATLLADGRVLVAGGYLVGSTPSTEIYDPATGKWTEVGPLAASRYGHALVTLPDGTVLAAGGYSDWEGEYQATAERFDPATSKWSPAASLPGPRHRALWTALADGRVLLAGGEDASSKLDSAVIYDPQLDTWSPTGSMGNSRQSEHGCKGAALLADGRVLVAGMIGGGNATRESALLYDPASGTWTATGSLSAGRTFSVLHELPDGRVLLTGNEDVDPVEVFDPQTGAWRVTAAVISARSGYTSAVLADGAVLVCGGTNQATHTGACERYW